jgi:hypothetical protein
VSAEFAQRKVSAKRLAMALAILPGHGKWRNVFDKRRRLMPGRSKREQWRDSALQSLQSSKKAAPP